MQDNLNDTIAFERPAAEPAFNPSMKGTLNDEPLLAEYLRANFQFAHDGIEAFRIADRQTDKNKVATLNMAAEIAMRDLLEKAA